MATLNGNAPDVQMTNPEVTAKRFRASSGPDELFFVVQVPANLPWPDQLAALERAYDNALAAEGLSHDSAVFRRLFLSDILNQLPGLRQSKFVVAPDECTAAVSIVQQPPLNGSKIAMLAYHIDGGIEKRRISERHLIIERKGRRHLWSMSLGAQSVSTKAETLGAEAGTEAAFGDLVSTLEAQGGSLHEHCVRTWLYVKDIDLFYAGLVSARTRLFARNGFVPGGNTIASTGIEGGGARPGDIVTMDAYSILDLKPQQKSFLNAFDHMCRPNDYAVTFERGTKIAYADRAHLFISGTASIDPSGHILHDGDVVAQARRAVENVEALLKAGGASLSDMLYWIVYLRDPADTARVMPVLTGVMAGVPTVFAQGAVCRPQWLVEVEGVAAVRQDVRGLPPF